MEYRRCSLVLVHYKRAAHSAERDSDLPDADLVAGYGTLAIAAGSAAWIVVAGPIRYFATSLDS